MGTLILLYIYVGLFVAEIHGFNDLYLAAHVHASEINSYTNKTIPLPRGKKKKNTRGPLWSYIAHLKTKN